LILSRESHVNMRHENLLDARQSALVIVDLQEAFRRTIFEFDRIVARTAIVARAAKLLGVPVIVTEQNRAKLGTTVAEIRAVLPEGSELIDKMAFSCCGAAGFGQQLDQTRARQVMVTGIEAHVCVSQTVHDLLAAGLQVHVLRDCVSSRTERSREIGFEKMTRAGALPSTSEMALFELMVDANHEQFRAIQKLIK
jgi:nicotinamidase-related amidase